MSKLTYTIVTAPLASIETPLLAVALTEGTAVPASLAPLDQATGGVLGRAIASGDFSGKRDDTSLLYPAGGKAQRILLVGMGKVAEVTRNSVRRAAAVAAKRGRALGAKQLSFSVASEARKGTTALELGQAIAEGAGQGAWAFTELKAAPEQPKAEVESVAIVCEAREAKEVGAGQRIGEAIGAGQRLARYLQMQPGNVCTPTYLAEQARRRLCA